MNKYKQYKQMKYKQKKVLTHTHLTKNQYIVSFAYVSFTLCTFLYIY